MKKLLLLITIFTLMFTTCSSDDYDDGTLTNTSFVVKNTNDASYKNVVAGYFAKDGKCKKIATIGDMLYNQTSTEIKVTNSDITEVFLFTSDALGVSFK